MNADRDVIRCGPGRFGNPGKEEPNRIRIRLLSDGSSPTPPEARFALDNVVDGASCVPNYMRLTRRFTGYPSHFRAEMRVHPENDGTVFRLAAEDAPPDAAADAASYSCNFTARAFTPDPKSPTQTQIQIAWDEVGGQRRSSQTQQKATRYPFDRWQRVVVEVDLESFTMSVDWDGQVQTRAGIPPECRLPTLSAQIGVHCAKAPQAVSFDDVAFWAW